ncbi:hypothetical protein GCM10027592_23490 [Spirosoma flavus]
MVVFPALRENAIINTMVIAFNKLLMKNVCGKNSIKPIRIDSTPKYGMMPFVMPKSAIIFVCSAVVG